MLDGNNGEGRGFTRHWNLIQYSIYPGINFDGVQFPFIIPGYCQHCRLIRHWQTQSKRSPSPPRPASGQGIAHSLWPTPGCTPARAWHPRPFEGPSQQTGLCGTLGCSQPAPSPSLPPRRSPLPLHSSTFRDDTEGRKRCNISLLTLSSHEFRILFSEGLII